MTLPCGARASQPVNDPPLGCPCPGLPLQVSVVEGEEQRGMHTFKCADGAAAKELNDKILEFV